MNIQFFLSSLNGSRKYLVQKQRCFGFPLVFLLLPKSSMMVIIALVGEVFCLFLEYKFVFQLAWQALSLDSSKMLLFLLQNLLYVFRGFSYDYAESKQINLVPCLFECLVLPLLCHLLSVTEVHVIFIFSQSDCILCVSAVPILPKGYSLVLLFVVCLDSFVSCCNSCAADNTKRLTAMTKLRCS